MEKGCKVICINDSIDPDKYDEISNDFQEWVVQEQIYTVREILENDGIVTGILLEEIVNRPLFMKLIGRIQEPAFAMWRFREIEVNKTTSKIEEKHLAFT